MPDNDGFKTSSERAFAGYLRDLRIAFEYEPKPAGPDFLVQHLTTSVLCEVTERAARRLSEAPKAIRKEIQRKSRQGREAKGSAPYVLVLQFLDTQNADLDETLFLEAMFGSHQATWPHSDAEELTVRFSFGLGGRLQRTLNTRFSAVASLQVINPTVPELLARIHVAWRDAASESDPIRIAREVEAVAVADGAYDPAAEVTRLLVFHNPYAKLQVPRDLFAGAYDVQWALVGREYRSLIRGPGAEAYDEALARLARIREGQR